MRRTLSLIASDLRNAVRPTLPVVGMLAALVAYIVATKMFLAARIDPDLLDAPTLADCLICAFAGVVPVGFVPGEDFVFPMDWFVVMLSLALVTLVYPERNLARVGGDNHCRRRRSRPLVDFKMCVVWADVVRFMGRRRIGLRRAGPCLGRDPIA